MLTLEALVSSVYDLPPPPPGFLFAPLQPNWAWYLGSTPQELHKQHNAPWICHVAPLQSYHEWRTSILSKVVAHFVDSTLVFPRRRPIAHFWMPRSTVVRQSSNKTPPPKWCLRKVMSLLGRSPLYWNGPLAYVLNVAETQSHTPTRQTLRSELAMVMRLLNLSETSTTLLVLNVFRSPQFSI